MFERAVGAIFPGIREARPPLLAGLLWALALWWKLGDAIPLEDDAEGFPLQLYRVADQAGPVVSAVVVATLLLVVGAISVTISDQIAELIASLTAEYRSRTELYDRADRYWERITREYQQLQIKYYQRLEEDPGYEIPSDVREKQRRLEREFEVLGVIRGSRNPLIPRSLKPIPNEVLALVERTLSASDELAYSIINSAIERGANEVLIHANVKYKKGVLNFLSDQYVSIFLNEVKSNPMNVLAAADPDEFQSADRRRSERQLRSSISFPLMIGSILMIASGSVIYGVALVIATTFMFAKANGLDEDIELLTLQSISSRQFETTAVRHAYDYGRRVAFDAIRAFDL